jgi:hypothetical protein
MEKEIIFQNKIVETIYFPEIYLVENKWLEKVAFQQEVYRTTFMRVVDFARQKRVDFFLSDIRNQGVVPTSEKNWFKNVILPLAVEVGIKYGAVITSGNVFKTYYMNAIIKMGSIFDLPIKLFTDREKAIKWLTSREIKK